MTDIFKFKEVLNDRFFTVHQKNFDILVNIFVFDSKLFEQALLQFHKLNQAAKRKKKMKNRIRVVTEMQELIKGINLIKTKLNKMVNAYEKVLNRYGKEELKESFKESLEFIRSKIKM